MSKDWIPRRSLLSGLAASILAPFAGLFGAKRAKAKESGSSGTLYRIVIDRPIKGSQTNEDGWCEAADIPSQVTDWSADGRERMQTFDRLVGLAEKFDGSLRLQVRHRTGLIETVEWFATSVISMPVIVLNEGMPVQP